jgi:hypothetical protein
VCLSQLTKLSFPQEVPHQEEGYWEHALGAPRESVFESVGHLSGGPCTCVSLCKSTSTVGIY